MRDLALDLRVAVRSLRKTPVFTALTITIVAIGIGANTAIFSLVDAALFRRLPFPDADRLTMLWERSPARPRNRVTPLNFVDWSEQNHTFAALAAVSGGGRILTGAGAEPERIPGQSVTTAFFDVLGVRPIAGRTFTADDGRLEPDVVVISERLWKRRFGAAPDIIGRPILLDSQPFTVVGIVPATFEILYRSELWTPYLPRRTPEQRRMHYMQVLGRLRPDATLDGARADMALVARQIEAVSPQTNEGWGVTIEPLRDALVGDDLHTMSIVLFAIVGFVLTTVCANVANLLLARGTARTREIAVRAALGGSPARIVRQLLTESLVLAGAGGAAGWTLAWTMVRIAPSLMPPDTLPQAIVLSVDTRLAIFAVVISTVTGLLFGAAPAWHAARVPTSEALASGGRTATGSSHRFRTSLAIVEVAVGVVLVSGATLFARTVKSLHHVDTGFAADRLLTMYVSPPLSRYPTPEDALTFYERVRREIGALPGVRAVAIGGSLPLDGFDIGQGFEVVGAKPDEPARRASAHYQIVGATYFDTLGIRILRGRAFTEHDGATSAPVCIVNEEFARRYLADRDPVGARVAVSAMDPAGPRTVVREVVGVSRQVKVQGPGEKQNVNEIYVPILQNPWYSASIAVKTAGEPMALATAVRAAVARVDTDLPVTRLRTMDEVAAESVSQPRFRAELAGLFAALALLLAAGGVFGVLAFAVNQRLREFGIRRALGAQALDLARLVAAAALEIIIAGTLAGALSAAALTRFLAALLYGVRPLDPLTFVAAPLLLIGVAAIAAIAPAVRAMRVDPAAWLRID
ncbi:MAG TPA: ABC transporter permease [Vicinamibacterales bacterium]|nr:ABC transporter permease [Vicinamibacterales bacterium]